ncbi:MAG: hypothetical protein LC648_09265 [Novosphingobium sp.]|nr:hypothetical protein [Novosphingobium sp.]
MILMVIGPSIAANDAPVCRCARVWRHMTPEFVTVLLSYDDLRNGFDHSAPEPRLNAPSPQTKRPGRKVRAETGFRNILRSRRPAGYLTSTTSTRRFSPLLALVPAIGLSKP